MSKVNKITNGVMLNAYPDSIGKNLSDTVAMLKMPEFNNAFSLFYVLPTFFNSDLDRGFSVIDYNLNKDLVSESDLLALKQLNIQLKFDIVLNHLSVASPQFKDLLKNGNNSKYKDFFINWNTFYQKVDYDKGTYLGQMDVNARSPLVWDFYEETLKKVSDYGCSILRLDAFAYLHKEIGQTNFFNKPGTWDYLERIKQIAKKNDLTLLPEIHAEYGLHLHDEVANEGYQIYDFFLPGLMIHTIENATNKALLTWANEIISKGYKTVNMLGCHDGIPVLDLKGKEVNGTYNKGLLEDNEIEAIMNKIMERGGRVKNLYDPSGNKISYYQVNATFFSALGESEQKLLLARAIQMFMPGIPQVWYLDIFAGKNDYEAADKGGSAGHKEINRTNLTKAQVQEGLKKDIVKNQLDIIRLRNTSKAFLGSVKINDASENEIDIRLENGSDYAQLKANLETCTFTISYSENKLSKISTF